MKHKVVIIILYDSERRFLLQHRSSNAWIMPNQWAFFGGEIKQGETPEAAVIREAYEELHYKLQSPQLVLEQNFTEGSIKGYMYVYIEAFKGKRSCLQLREGQDWGWFKELEIAPLNLIERDRKIIASVVSYLEKNMVFMRG